MNNIKVWHAFQDSVRLHTKLQWSFSQILETIKDRHELNLSQCIAIEKLFNQSFDLV